MSVWAHSYEARLAFGELRTFLELLVLIVADNSAEESSLFRTERLWHGELVVVVRLQGCGLYFEVREIAAGGGRGAR